MTNGDGSAGFVALTRAGKCVIVIRKEQRGTRQRSGSAVVTGLPSSLLVFQKGPASEPPHGGPETHDLFQAY